MSWDALPDPGPLAPIHFDTDRRPAHTPHLGPSSAPRWMPCTASPAYTATLPRPAAGAAADRGTMLHTRAELYQEGETVRAFEALAESDKKALKDAILMLGALRANPTNEGDRVDPLQPEHKVSVDSIDPEIYGTLDLGWTESRGQQITAVNIGDYKFGRIPVLPESPQLLIYLLGYLEELIRKQLITMQDVSKLTLKTHVLQPAAGRNPLTYVVPFEELMHFRMRLSATVHKIRVGDVEFAPSEKACTFCPGKATCPALVMAGKELAAFKETEGKPGVTPASNAEVEHLLDLAAGYSKHVKAVQELAARRALDGAKFEKWGLKPKAKRRVWKDEAAAAKKLGELGMEAYSQALISPAQAEGQTEEDLSDLIETPKTDEVNLVKLGKNATDFMPPKRIAKSLQQSAIAALLPSLSN